MKSLIGFDEAIEQFKKQIDSCNATRYSLIMISSFQHKGLKNLYERNITKGLPAQYVSKIRRILSVIDTASSIDEINLYPGWRLHRLSGDFGGFWSLTVTGNWRIIFKFEAGDASELDYVDYH